VQHGQPWVSGRPDCLPLIQRATAQGCEKERGHPGSLQLMLMVTEGNQLEGIGRPNYLQLMRRARVWEQLQVLAASLTQREREGFRHGRVPGRSLEGGPLPPLLALGMLMCGAG